MALISAAGEGLVSQARIAAGTLSLANLKQHEPLMNLVWRFRWSHGLARRVYPGTSEPKPHLAEMKSGVIKFQLFQPCKWVSSRGYAGVAPRGVHEYCWHNAHKFLPLA